MLRWLAGLLRERDRFCMPESMGPLPSCSVRTLREADFHACEAIYRLNEPTKFPQGYFDRFAEWLRQREDLILVVESDAGVIAVGGIFTYEQNLAARKKFPVLIFGMVHPEHQRRGFGTVLLLARLSSLAAPDPDYAVLLSATGGSETFYGRFGFRSVRREPDEKGNVFDTCRMHLYARDWKTCRSMLSQASVDLNLAGESVPSRQVAAT